MSTASLGYVVPILPPKGMEGQVSQATIRLPKEMMDRIDRIAASDGYSRNEVIYYFLKWAIAEYEREQREAAKKK